MPLIRWNDKYSVNNDELDAHHKHLFNLLNRLYDDCISRSKENYAEVALDEFIAYADYHCKAEEQYLTDIGYSEIDNHTLLHSKLVKSLKQLKQKSGIENNKFQTELIALIGKWICNHILEEDMKYCQLSGARA